MNINILNKVIQGISEQLPLVNSFYTQSPYESWNVKEVQYGSVSFVVTKVNTRESTTTYDAVLYYADRLTENRSNRDAIHSDAATVIQTIVGALNTADEYFEVDYPVSITLFEQDFADILAGGYANLTISVEGMGECFEDDWSVPEIIATSAYYTKDEIAELFPLRSNLSLVAFTGRFEDLSSKPDVVTQSQYDDLYQGVKETTGLLAEQIADKLDAKYFGEFRKNIETQLDDTVSQRQFDELYKGVLESTGVLASEMNGKLDAIYFATFKEQLQNQLDAKVDDIYFESFKTTVSDIAKQVADKVSSSFFDSTISAINSKLDNTVTQQQYDDLYQGVYDTTAQLAESIASKLDSVIFAAFKTEVNNQIETKLDRYIFDAFKANIEHQLANKAPSSLIDSLFNSLNTLRGDVNNKVDKQSFDNYAESTDNKILWLKTHLEDKVDDSYFKTWQTTVMNELSERVTVQGFANYAANVYTKSEIEERIANYQFYVEQYLNSNEFTDYINEFVTNTVTEFVEQYLETVLDYYTKAEIDEMLSNLSLDDYYTKAETDNKLNSYYTKSEVNTKFNDYYTKTNVKELLRSYYTKSEVNSMIGDIDSILNNVLYEY